MTQASHWPSVKRYANTVAMSAMEAAKVEQDESETVTAMAGLSMQNPNRYDYLNYLPFYTI